MFWGCFTASAPGQLVQVNKMTKKDDYLEKMNNNLKESDMDLSLGRCLNFMQDNDPKNFAKLTRKWVDSNIINVLKGPSQSSDLNLTENLSKY